MGLWVFGDPEKGIDHFNYLQDTAGDLPNINSNPIAATADSGEAAEAGLEISGGEGAMLEGKKFKMIKPGNPEKQKSEYIEKIISKYKEYATVSEPFTKNNIDDIGVARVASIMNIPRANIKNILTEYYE